MTKKSWSQNRNPHDSFHYTIKKESFQSDQFIKIFMTEIR